MSAMSPKRPEVTPSPGASSISRDDDPVHIETTDLDGNEVTVVRDSDGHIVYPYEVPPETKSPTSLNSPKSPEPQSASKEDSSSTPFNNMKGSLIPPEKSPLRAPPKGRSASDAAAVFSHNRTFGSHAALKRAETNVSELNRALEQVNTYDDTSSDSSTSSDEDDDASQRAQRSRYRRFQVGNQHYRTRGKVSKRDGRLTISVKDTSNTGYLAKALGQAAKKVVPPLKKDVAGTEQQRKEDGSKISESLAAITPEGIKSPRLNIVIMVIGSRGDAQPFLKVGKVLKEQYGHRVRIATHPAFRDFVEKDSGLEFFSVGGDPSELMAFMVKNPGMIPTLDTVKSGDIGRRRASMAEMFEGFWRACINATDGEKSSKNAKMMAESNPFVADAIIANPPSFAHVHCAEALGIPLHLMFTFPYTPTQAFPHPLASIKKSNVDPGYTNFISYPLVELMVWQGLGDLVNEFRVKTLGLDPVSTLWAPGATYRLHVPFTYLWSPGLVPKPEDWGSEIDVSGFVFLDLASTFKPPSPLTKFLDAGEMPIYIGFGSIVVDDANRFTEMIFEAVKLAGVRALVSKGWGGLGKDSLDIPDNIFMLDNIPHDWLFPRVRACVIHGGAGTTAISLKCGKPTMIVPFFGDQHFWGAMVGSAGAGPEPVPYKELTAEKLAEGIKYCLTDEAVEAAKGIAKRIEAEGDGAENACQAFHKHLTLSGKNSMRCSILEDKTAVWQLKNTNLRLSPMAADYIVNSGFASYKKFRLLRHNEWNDFEGPGEPVTGLAGSIVSAAGNVFGGIGGVPYRFAKQNHERKEKKEKRQKRLAKRREEKEKEAAEKAKGKRREQPKSRNSSVSPPPPAPSTEAKDHVSFPDDHQQQQPDSSPQSNNHNNDSSRPNLDDDSSDSDSEHPFDNTRRLSRRETNITLSTVNEENPAEEFVHEVGRGAVKTAAAIARAPMDLSLALAQGFHNAPRLYGDDTVRRPTRVTGIKSGLKAAKYEFVYGIYDGWTGLVRLPVRGAKDDGVRGFVKGVGMGVTGFVLKDIAALFGPVGYTLKGVVKQVERNNQPLKHIRLARVVQGQNEIAALSEQERQEMARQVEHGWEVMRSLWMALEQVERNKGGIRARFGARKRGKRSLGAAFESVEIAEKALAALKRGESVESVIGEQKGRESEDRGKSSSAAYAEQQGVKRKNTSSSSSVGGASRSSSVKGVVDDRKRGGKNTQPNGGAASTLRKASTSSPSSPSPPPRDPTPFLQKAKTDGHIPSPTPSNTNGHAANVSRPCKIAERILSNGNGTDPTANGRTSSEEKREVERNPFSPSPKDIEKNRVEFQKLLERERLSKSPVEEILAGRGERGSVEVGSVIGV